MYLFRIKIYETVARYMLGQAVNLEALANRFLDDIFQRASRVFAELS